MVSLQTIAQKLLLGQAYFAELIDQEIGDLIRCGQSVVTSKLICLNRIIRALTWDVDDEVNDEDTQEIYAMLLKQLAGYTGAILPNDPNVVIPGTTIVIAPGNVLLTSLVFPTEGDSSYTFPELIGNNVLTVYRGTGTTLRVRATPPDNEYAQFNSITGEITVSYSFNGAESFWAEYKTL